MNNKLILWVFALMHLSFATYAGDNGNIKVKWGDEYELPKKHVDQGFFGNTTEGYLDISYLRDKELTIQHFSTELKLTGEQSISLGNMPKNYIIEKILSIGGGYYLCYSTWEKSDPVERLFAQEIDVTKGAFKGVAKEIASTNERIAQTSPHKHKYSAIEQSWAMTAMGNKWFFIHSADESKLLIYYRLKPAQKRDAVNNDIIGFDVYDSKLQKLWAREVTMPYTEKMMDNEDYQVDKNGTAYILGKVFEAGSKESKDGHPNYHYELLVYANDGKSTSAKFDLGEKYVVDAALIEDKNARIICTGYYSMNKKVNSTAGVFFLTYDEGSKAMKNIYKGYYGFPDDLIRQNESKRVQNKISKDEEKGKNDEIPNLEFHDLAIDDAGGFCLFGEQYREESTFTGNSSVRYFYDDIYAMKIGADGELKWAKKIAKRQLDIYSSGGTVAFKSQPEYMSFFLHSFNKDNYIFFLDDPANLDLPASEVPVKYRAGARGILTCVRIDEKGALTKSSIFGFKEESKHIRIDGLNTVTKGKIMGRAYDPGYINIGKPLLISID